MRLLTQIGGECQLGRGQHPTLEVLRRTVMYGMYCRTDDGMFQRFSPRSTLLSREAATPHAAYFGMIDGLQLKNWWKTHGKGLVASNIRHSLGPTDVNNQIRSTATTTPENFWYFNNGITLIADEAVKAPAGASSKAAGNFRLKNSSIVNGAQTVSSLAKVEDDAKLGMVRVPFHVILLTGTPSGFGQEVGVIVLLVRILALASPGADRGKAFQVASPRVPAVLSSN
ncbi:AIPR family protein [Cupriavidus sp. WKF15]|uniref:AIPR family protein n=1 Tax=Cupriavidus sp. WKF15 TaxID=3032282 RepID=UPI0023E14F6A|nr:AIPR family protein [Cupriavidus sp. WKF15]WER48600.1 AIPR family protein [Cupriavidus sp. WKF15]